MSKYKYIKADVYRRGITIFIGNPQELIGFVKQAYKDDQSFIQDVVEHVTQKDLPIATTFKESYGQSLIWIPKFPKTPKEVSCLAHEILHATFVLLDYVNVEYRYEGPNEPYTYLFEYFLNKALTEKGYKEI